MSENIIFCFSGTGNCLDIAKNIARELGDTDVVMMRRAPEITDARHAGRLDEKRHPHRLIPSEVSLNAIN